MNECSLVKKALLLPALVLLTLIFSANLSAGLDEQLPLPTLPKAFAQTNHPTIIDITITGIKNVREQAVLNRLPYKKGGTFDPEKSGQAIHSLYNLGFFRQIRLEREDVGDNQMRLHVVCTEKQVLEKIIFKGNKALKKKKLKEKLNTSKLTTIDEETVAYLKREIKKLYKEENYHHTTIEHELVTNEKSPDRATLTLHINDGAKSVITRVFFKGNTKIPSRKISNFIFTREQWLLGFLSDAGKYSEEQFAMDKHRIEYFYRDNGYLMARVVDAHAEFAGKNEVHITFEIREGDLFTVKKIEVLGDDVLTEKDLMPYVLLDEGQPFSQKKMVDSINRLRAAWGEKGYIYADIHPQVVPDEKEKTVNITFHSERGNKMYVNRINITGNSYTRDKVIRREIILEEGDLLTQSKMNISKNNVEFLSYFERGGVNWKIHRITDELVDLEMNVQETKTGAFNFNLTYGSDKHSKARSLKGVIQLSKKNIFGQGWDMSTMIQGNRHRFQRFQIQAFDPYLWDTNVSGGFDFYVRREDYDQFPGLRPQPVERVVGGTAKLGFMMPTIDNRLQFLLELGSEDLRYNKKDEPIMVIGTPELVRLKQPIIDGQFKAGHLNWLDTSFILDTRNHKVYPNRGYKVIWSCKYAPALVNDSFSFFKSELEASWYSALIGEDSLVLGVRAKAGMVRKMSKDKIIPFKELFHMGGQNTVRGFTWGGISPIYARDPIGGRNAVLFNAELIFPLLDNYSMKAHFFYDAGAGWDAPKDNICDTSYLRRDKFNLRHSIGFGLNLLQPQPVKIDWGYKLDRDKAAGESPFEWHISMNMAF